MIVLCVLDYKYIIPLLFLLSSFSFIKALLDGFGGGEWKGQISNECGWSVERLPFEGEMRVGTIAIWGS